MPAGSNDGPGDVNGPNDVKVPDTEAPHPETPASTGVDRLRLRSFIGLSIGLVGPRANLAVSGVLLTLLVSSRVSSAVAITFALTANRLIGWVAYPLLGRASDLTRSRAGRRAPYMAAGLLVMGVCTWGYTLVPGYWLLVLLIVMVKTASVIFGLTNVAVIPETFGKSRSLKAATLIGIVGALVSLVIKGTVIATWRPHDPASWNLSFRVAGGFMVGVAFIVLLLVRESAAARQVADKERRAPAKRLRDELPAIWAAPNSPVLISGILVFWAGLSATGYLAIVYFQKVQHAGANVQTIASYLSGVPVVMLGLGLGYFISRALTRKQVAVLTPIGGTIVALIQITTTHIWQTVVLAFIGGPMFAAFAISLAPMILQLLPRSGGMGELLGKLVAPFSLFAVAFSFLAAWTVDVSGDYRVIWLYPAVAGIIQSVIMCFLKVPVGHERPELDGLVERMSESILDQMMGRDRSLLGGDVTAEDADSASLFDMAREILGNPYEQSAPHERSDEMNTVVEVLRAVQPVFLAGSIEEQRAGWDLFGTAEPLPPDVTVSPVDAGGVRAEWVQAPGSSPDHVVMYLHGGGFVIGSLDSHRAVAGRLSAAAGVRVLLVDYRLAPEHRFPAALDDATAAWKWLVASHTDGDTLAVAGDSAGAGLAVSLSVVAYQEGSRGPDALLCISPWVDLTGSGNSILARADDDVVISAQWLTTMAAHYLGDTPPATPLASPLFADLMALPPTLIMVGTAEILYDDAIRLGRAINEAGGDVTVEEFAGCIHEWTVLAPSAPESAAALEQAAAFLRAERHADAGR